MNMSISINCLKMKEFNYLYFLCGPYKVEQCQLAILLRLSGLDFLIQIDLNY